MLKDIEMMAALVDQILQAKNISGIDTSILDQVYLPIIEKLKVLSTYLEEMQEGAKQIASGNFESSLNKYNPYIGALKDLQASFHHLTWQLQRVAKGDYKQSVDYLGEVSTAFNTMIMQLKERETLLLDNIELTKEVAWQQSRLLESEIEHQVAKYDQFSKSVKEIRTYRHDMQNHLLCIDALLQENNIVDAKKYISELTAIFTTKKGSLNDKNYILNALLIEKIEQAKRLKTTVTTNIKVTRKLKISNPDWCIVFGNALDNSLEAVSKISPKQRKLNINIINKGNMLCAVIGNTMKGSLEFNQDNQLITSKSDAYLHGIGLKNIENCVKKYNGEMKISSEGSMFYLTIILCNVQNNS